MPDHDAAIATVAPSALGEALATLCCRFGTPEEEAYRRGRVRALLHSSRDFATALERFVHHAMPHARGEHCTSDMQTDVDALVQALSDWSFSVNASADAYRECRSTGARAKERPETAAQVMGG